MVQPQVACGSLITAANDVDPGTAGVQIVARVISPGGLSPFAHGHQRQAGPTAVQASSDVTITVEPGQNFLSGSAVDAYGNHGQSDSCTISLADITVAVAAPADDGFVGRGDGTVSGGMLTFPLCGTVDRRPPPWR